MRKALKIAAAIAALPLLLVGGLYAFAIAQHWQPPPRQDEPVRNPPGIGRLQAGQPFTVVSWNLQFGTGRSWHFFYDGGTDVLSTPEVTERTVAAITEALRGLAPDIALLQEVDRDSRRSGYLDQLPRYAEAMPGSAVTTATYYKSAFVPTPGPTFMGKVLMDLVLFSRFELGRAERVQLAMLDEPAIRQAFNLKRALQIVSLPVEGWPLPLLVAQTHLSAFSRGDGTLQKQVAVLAEWMGSHPPEQPWILAGDFNLLPVGDDPARLAVQDDSYDPVDNAIAAIWPRFREVSGDAVLDPAQRTYIPFGADAPDRKIDWAFFGGPVELVEAQVHAEHLLSDHLPMRAVFRIGPAPAAEPAAPPAEEAAEDGGPGAPPAGAALPTP
jgi:endonuclease/exonuclease/phosphatase family metal-dependent hydrolase